MAVQNNNSNINQNTPVVALKGGTGVSSPTIHGIVVAQGSSPVNLKVLTNGQLLIGNTGVDPVGANLTASDGINIVNGAGSVTLNTIPNAKSSLPFNFMMMGG